MNRLRDYVGFAVWFAGLGYMAIWPLSASGTDSVLFGASILCRAPASFALLAPLCNMQHPLALSPALHVLGLLSLIVVALRLAYGALCRIRRARAINATVALHRIRIPAASKWALRQKPLRPLPQVKPRNQFGLRGTPH